MEVFNGIPAAAGRLGAPAVALGNFDGVHLGHQALFSEATRRARARLAKAVTLTFDPHPGKVLSPAFAPPLICSLPRRIDLMEAAGLDAVVVQPFDASFAARGPDDFLAQDLFGSLAAGDVVVGPDFTYGRDRGGGVESLRLQCQDRGVGLAVMGAVRVDGIVVSSTKIRELVLEGRVTAAARLLGRPFDVAGRVVHGEGRGRKLGFPTVNLAPDGELWPATGVYAVRVFLADGRALGGAANVGRKPTFGGGPETIEVHLADFSGDLYGQRVAVEFIDRLRPEERFPSAEALASQIGRDVEAARRALAGVAPPGRSRPRS